MPDLVNVTRCKNCKNSLYISKGGYLWCRKPLMHAVESDGYCDGAIPKGKEESDD